VILGRIGSILGQKSALPKLLKNTIVLYAYFVFNAYFIVLNVPKDRMTYPRSVCMLGHEAFMSHVSCPKNDDSCAGTQ